jgi:transmembrane sensor
LADKIVNKEILYRYIQGLASEQEVKDIEMQLSQDPDFLKEYELLKKLELAVLQYQYPDSSKNAVWDKMNKGSHKKKLNLIQSKWVRVAAILVVLLTVTLIYKNESNSKEILTIKSDQHGEMFDLPDGSNVWLQEGSELSYFNNTKENIRQATLNGVGFFVVKPNDNKNFEVLTKHLKVLVLGTAFEVAPKSVSVQRGKVEVSSKTNTQTVVLGANEIVSMVNGEISEPKPTENQIASWRVQGLKFNNQTLSTIVEAIELHYQIKVIFDESLLNQKFTFNFVGLDLEDVISLLEQVTATKVKFSNKEYHFKL